MRRDPVCGRTTREQIDGIGDEAFNERENLRPSHVKREVLVLGGKCENEEPSLLKYKSPVKRI